MKTSRKNGILSVLLLCGMALSLSACGNTTDTTYPIGVGTGPNSLKYSPCR